MGKNFFIIKSFSQRYYFFIKKEMIFFKKRKKPSFEEKKAFITIIYFVFFGEITPRYSKYAAHAMSTRMPPTKALSIA